MVRAPDQKLIAVAGTNRAEIRNLMRWARVLAQVRGDAILALGMLTVPPDESLSAGVRGAIQLRQALERIERGADARTQVIVSHQPWVDLEEILETEAVNLLLVSWGGSLPENRLRAMPCDVLIARGGLPPRARKILLPVRGGPTAALALWTALDFAQVFRGEITLLHVAPVNDPPDEEFLQHLRALPQITRWVNARGDAGRAIVRETRRQRPHLLVLGAIAHERAGDSLHGPVAQRVMERSNVPALVVKSRRASLSRANGHTPPIDHTISVVVDKWFAENTFHAHEFEDLAELMRMKERQGVTISLGLPALNEEKTIGKILRTVRRELMCRYPLIDEIVVIDSDSTDRTAEIARAQGVPVCRHSEILTGYGSRRGKGEALWKSLGVLRGDLIAWVDTDIANFHPRFVYGILGPLLQDPRLQYVKGFYQRPLRYGKKMEARGGGRVTELTARPLINLFYPVLSGLVQPLAGEYAGRRAAFESVPFFTGYGVEIGLLIDLLARYGLQSIGQVDLKERVHRNQSLLELSKMAFAITQVVLQRVGASHKVELLETLNASMKMIRSEPDQFRLDLYEIRDQERPPMITLPEYRHALSPPER